MLKELTTDEISELRFPLAFKNLSGVKLSHEEARDLKLYSEELQRRMEKEEQIDLALELQYMLLAKMNLALDNTIYVLAKNDPAHCELMISEILKIVIQINRDIETIIKDSERYQQLSEEADLRMLEVGDTETRFFKEFVKNDFALFEQINTMVENAVDRLNLEEETHYLTSYTSDTDDDVEIVSRDATTHKRDGLNVIFRKDELLAIEQYENDSISSQIIFSEMGESAKLTLLEKKEDKLDFGMPALLLGAVAALKIGSALASKKSSHVASAVATADVGVQNVKK